VLVESARKLPAVVGEESPLFAALSPNGAHIAYYIQSGLGANLTSQICIYTFDGAGKKCHTLPADRWQSNPYQLQWSPDNTTLAFTENPVGLADDADIWVLKVADGSFANLTDDGVVGAWRQPDGTSSSTVDYLPMWNPSDGKIYFWRFIFQGESTGFTVAIYRISPQGGNPELVRDLTGVVPNSLVAFKQEEFFLDGPSVMSPDGKTVAVLLTTADETGTALAGLWQISLADAAAAPRVLMAPSAFNAALPAWQPAPAFPAGVAWTSDGKGVVTLAQSKDVRAPFTLFYYVDAESGSATPVVDFKGLANPEAYFQPAPGSDYPLRVFSPWTGSVSPKGDKVLMVNDLGGTTGLLTAGLPPNGSLPVVSATAEATTALVASRSSRSQDGKMLVYGLLLKVKE
jgi:dipeptidyl aminopeptidase/acylaminoacyl peptidase